MKIKNDAEIPRMNRDFLYYLTTETDLVPETMCLIVIYCDMAPEGRNSGARGVVHCYVTAR
jgi:hypothetical protein